MRVIGTAGHVDHGKSTLVRRLTGIEPDRLAEEKAREMTIDLGFAWMPAPNGETIGIVDVPGHRDFIENMLAGVGGVDAVLLVIAADEGIMPQTREHLAILDLLGIEHGLIVLTKTDLIDDPDWLDLIEQDIYEELEGTALENAAIIRVSAHSGDGIPTLNDRINALLSSLPDNTHGYQPHLSVDRVFTISGFGTVVTGTLLGGQLRVGDEIELQPGEKRGRVRSLQSYKQSVDIAQPGSRVAVNISGVEKTEATRGQKLTLPGQIYPTLMADVYFRHLPDAGRALKHNAQVKVFCGAAESLAHVRLLNDETLPPAAEGWLQLRFENPMPLIRGDRYILRYPSPAQTIGGGIVINPNPRRKWKRFQKSVITHLETLMQGTPGERLAQAAEGREPTKRLNLQKQIGYNDSEFKQALAEALHENLIVDFDGNQVIAMSSYQAIQKELTTIVTGFHTEHPLRIGVPREELRSRLGMKNTTLTLFLDSLENLITEGNIVRSAEHTLQFTKQQEQRIDRLAQQMQNTPYTPPSYAEATALVGEAVLHALIELGEIVQVQPDVIFGSAVYDEMVTEVLNIIDEHNNVDAKGLRDRFNTSRKYAIGLLEHLDSVGITRRVGDARVRGPRSKNL